jgi:hypothetical protein
MGLANTIQKAAKTAFKVIGDIPLTCTYTSKGTRTYTAATGAITSSDTDYTSLKILFEDYTAKEVKDSQNNGGDSAGIILNTDQKASIPNINLTPTPKMADIITDSASKKWTIEDVKLDAARALWVFQVRRST